MAVLLVELNNDYCVRGVNLCSSDCYIKDEGNENLISEIKNKVIKANLFYGAVECAESVLSSGLLKLSLISVGAFVLALI